MDKREWQRPFSVEWFAANQSVIKGKKNNESEERKMSLRWLEAVLPLGIIAGFLCVMGNAQYFIHKAAHGRPKHIGNDMWDVAMERRDKKMMEMLASPSSSS